MQLLRCGKSAREMVEDELRQLGGAGLFRPRLGEALAHDLFLLAQRKVG
jgi:hypothetical protein